MKYNSGICRGCENEKLIINKTHNLCLFCNQKRLYKKPKPKKRKATGEKIIFEEIWNERNHICINCKVHLGNEAKTFYFSHILPKGRFPQLRLIKSNIQLLCYDCHYAHDFKEKKDYQKRNRSF